MELEDLTPSIGETLVKYSRRVLEDRIRLGKELDPLTEPDLLLENAGIFCTLRINNQLRGCIGYPYPTHKLGLALVKATIQAALDDPRFKQVQEHELNEIDIELTILTPPSLIKVNDFHEYYKKINLGRDGLIIETENRRGLLLPQVPVEQHWDLDQFLEGICRKAYLNPDSWKDTKMVRLYKFQGAIFQEKK
jgi:uncharacterized protein (TIGR00296 family)